MNANVLLGSQQRFKLDKAVMVYTASGGVEQQVFATVHDVERGIGAPKLGVGSLVTATFLQALSEGLGAGLKPEVLPPNVICRTAHVIAWWTPEAMRPLFFRKKSELGVVSGKHFPVPALVWKCVGRELWVRALVGNERPSAETQLYRAPFWNTDPTGLVCQGSMKKPRSVSASTLEQWTDGYFAAEFTHVFDQFGAHDATSHSGGIVGLWKSLACGRTGEKAFPTDALISASESCQQFIERRRDRNA